MVETINKTIRVSRQLLQELGHDPSAEEIAAALKSFGFAYVALDLQGYRTGSMNETLKVR